MNRREFIAGVGSAAAWPMVGWAQHQDQPIRRIAAVIAYAKDDPEVKAYINAFDQELRELGWLDGGNVVIDHHYGAGDIDLMQKLARDIVTSKPDLILASSTPMTGGQRLLIRQEYNRAYPQPLRGLRSPSTTFSQISAGRHCRPR